MKANFKIYLPMTSHKLWKSTFKSRFKKLLIKVAKSPKRPNRANITVTIKRNLNN